MDARDRYDKWILDGKKGKDPRFTPVGRMLRALRLLAGIQQGTQAAYRGGAKRVRPGIYTELDGGP